MAYNRTNWVPGETPLSAGNMNNIEDGIEALFDSGIGSGAKTVDSWDNATKSGFYQSATGGPAGTVWSYGFVHSYDDTGNYLIQKIWTNTESGNFSSAERRRYNGAFGEWEWLNPDMCVGVEYRTTRRWNYSTVYTKLVDCGMLPNASSKQVKNVIPSGATVINMYGVALYNGRSYPIPYVYKSSEQISIWTNGTYIGLATLTDMTAYTAYVVIEYYKS